MPSDPVATHYGRRGIVEQIRAALDSLGIEPGAATVEDLAPVDEFHIGGRAATHELAERLELTPDLAVLDVGCGVGGTARFLAHAYGCRVTGLDLTPEYVDAARVLTAWLSLANQVEFHQGSALAMPLADGAFDRAVMVHVGMNIEDKSSLCSEIARVLRPGGRVGIYDVMRLQNGGMDYPVPWAEQADASYVATPAAYVEALKISGLEITEQRDRQAFAVEFMQTLRERQAASASRPALGLHLLMGESASTKLANMSANLAAGVVAPVEIYARKPDYQPS